MWLRDQLPSDFPNVRVLIYGYDTRLLKSESFQTIEDLAVSLIAQLRGIGKTQTFTKPLLIFAHSLGGLLVKQALCLLARCGESEAFMLDQVRLVVLFGVPSAGMRMEYLLPMVDGQPNQYLVECLSQDDPHGFLQTLNASFHGISRLRRIRLISAYETQRTRTAKETSPGVWARVGDPVILVPRESAIQKGSRNPEDVFPIDRDHSNLVKFSEDDIHYVTLQRFLREIPDSAPRSDFMGTIPPKILAVPDSQLLRFDGGEGTATQGGLKSLWFPEINYREEHIVTAHDHSYGWLYDPNLRFFEWLQSTRRLYWIRGKPGSGKSTLMKHLRKATGLWKGSTGHGSALHQQFEYLWFFFNARGSYKQKSFEGLLRSILFQLGSRYPIIAQVIEERHRAKQTKNKDVWTDDESLRLFEHVKCKAKIGRQVVLFLDALDEFNGYPEVIAEFLTRLSASPNEIASLDIRICFSSRPWDAFVERFDTCDGFKLQDWTQSDIARYTGSRLVGMLQSQFPTLDSESSRALEKDVAEYIRLHAQGVFLWVTMVLDELERVSRPHQSPTLLYKQLTKLPTELEDYYGLIIDRIAPKDRLEAFILLELVLRDSWGPTELGKLFLASRCAGGNTLEACEQLLKSAKTQLLEEKHMDVHLKDLCGGMLEVVESNRESVVQFMHETARDFIERPEFRQRILPQDGPSLDWLDGHVFWIKYWFAFRIPKQDIGKELYILKVDRMFEHAYSAEHRTGKSLANFLDSVPQSVFSYFSEPLQWPRPYFGFYSSLSFAVLAGLELYVSHRLSIAATEGPQGRSRLLNRDSDGTLAHGLIQEVCLGYRSRSRDRERSLGAMTQLLVDSGLNFNMRRYDMAGYEYLPIQVLFQDPDPHRRQGGGVHDECGQVLDILLKAGCDSNTRTTYARSATLNPFPEEDNVPHRQDQCRLLHVSWGILSQTLLAHGANVNAYDSRGHTPLDVCIGVKFWLLDTRSARQALETATALIEAGAHLSQYGHKHLQNRSSWNDFSRNKREETERREKTDKRYITGAFTESDSMRDFLGLRDDHGVAEPSDDAESLHTEFVDLIKTAPVLPTPATRRELKKLYPKRIGKPDAFGSLRALFRRLSENTRIGPG
ncbi:hypothetical protein EDD37DRAFT_13015 [Exophiala viscosa]|uniref:uncharacterized protein n=1 Tax=Exophiala viscosa TaxID=2486360 RepID=UPI00219BFA8D|nr:hypothetical protein EDD37DRAFT_13015 [Exophiala viscosa]